MPFIKLSIIILNLHYFILDFIILISSSPCSTANEPNYTRPSFFGRVSKKKKKNYGSVLKLVPLKI